MQRYQFLPAQRRTHTTNRLLEPSFFSIFLQQGLHRGDNIVGPGRLIEPYGVGPSPSKGVTAEAAAEEKRDRALAQRGRDHGDVGVSQLDVENGGVEERALGQRMRLPKTVDGTDNAGATEPATRRRCPRQ